MKDRQLQCSFTLSYLRCSWRRRASGRRPHPHRGWDPLWSRRILRRASLQWHTGSLKTTFWWQMESLLSRQSRSRSEERLAPTKLTPCNSGVLVLAHACVWSRFFTGTYHNNGHVQTLHSGKNIRIDININSMPSVCEFYRKNNDMNIFKGHEY